MARVTAMTADDKAALVAVLQRSTDYSCNSFADSKKRVTSAQGHWRICRLDHLMSLCTS
jgi:hypothetical protein